MMDPLNTPLFTDLSHNTMKPNPRYAKGGGRSGRVVKTADYISACSDFALGHAWPVESEGGCVESDRKVSFMRALTQRLYSLRDSTLGSPVASEQAQQAG